MGQPRVSFKTAKGTELPILNLRGKEYLQVMHRLVWFREEHPEWSIESEIIIHDVDRSVVKVTIRDNQNRLMAMAHKSEDKSGFIDHLEKSESGALGRALAMVGYGTQFTDDLDEGDRLADSPAPPKARASQKQPAPPIAPPKPLVNHAPKPAESAVSQQEFDKVWKVASANGWIAGDMMRVLNAYGVSRPSELDRFSFEEMSKAINAGAIPQDIIAAKKG